VRRASTGYLFGGLASAQSSLGEPAPCLHLADGVFEGGLSGVAFSADVALVSRVTQGCQPVGPRRRITASERNLVLTLDGERALDCLLADLGVDDRQPREAMPRLRQTLVGLSDAGDDAPGRPGQFGPDTRVRNLVGLDPARRGIAIGDSATVGTQLAFCTRNTEAARRDLVRICSEIREELEPETLPELVSSGPGADQGLHAAQRIAGAVYVSCAGRGGAHFGAPSAELAIVRHALGDVPLVGFFANGEIARRHLYGYTGVLTVFTA
jgi:small ligand-binding sensory domain FIST